jgi:putative intracellular protease/amidase
LNDKIAEMAFENTRALEDLNLATFDAVFYPGGHGPIWDLSGNATSGNIILQFLDSGRPVAAVCHGPAALIAAATIRPGLLAGRKVVSFTNAEEVLTFRADNVPYKLETRLKELGADFHSALVPFIPHVEVDGLLITGQNPASAGPTAKALIEKLEAQTVSLH